MTRVLFILLFASLIGCSSSSKIAQSKFQPIFDFSSIQSYSLYQRDAEFNEWQALSDANRNTIELAIEQAMNVKTLDFVEPEQADIVLTYFFVDETAQLLRKYNAGVNYCSYCLVNVKTGARKDRLAIVPGSLIIDAIKPKSKRSIWRASYPLNIKEKDNSQESSSKIKQAVNKMVNQLQLLLTRSSVIRQ